MSNIKKHTAKLRSHKHFRKGAIFVGVFAFFGAIVLLRSFAASPTAQFEPESVTPTSGATVVTDANASGGQAVQFGTAATSGSFPVHPGVVYSKAEIDAWSTSSADYTKLAATGPGSLTSTSSKYIPVKFTDQINGPHTSTTSELNLGLKDQSGYAKVQAVLYAADNNNARREKVISYLKEYSGVNSFEWDSQEQYRLVAGWGCTNLAQAAEIVDYQDAGFKRFLKDVCYPVMDWPTNPNWHASFADSKLAIAAHVGDEELWDDAKLYFYERIGQSIYHSAYDGNKVKPLHTSDKKTDIKDSSGKVINRSVPERIHTDAGTPWACTVPTNPANTCPTMQHWGASASDLSKTGQVNYLDNTLRTTYPIVDGMNAERLRDLGHVNMGIGGFMHGLRTLKAQGESDTAKYKEAYQRLLAAYSYHSQRVLAYEQTGSIPAPDAVGCSAGTACNGGTSRYAGYYGAKKLFGSATPASVNSMIGLSAVNTSYAYTVQNHLVAEGFADK